MMQNVQLGNEMGDSGREAAGIVLETRDLKKTYGSGDKSLPVLVNANLKLRRGEMVA